MECGNLLEDQTPQNFLHHGVLQSSIPLVKYSISQGASVSAKDNNGYRQDAKEKNRDFSTGYGRTHGQKWRSRWRGRLRKLLNVAK